MLNHLDDLSGLGEAGLRDLWERGVAPAAEDLAGATPRSHRDRKSVV